jgi:hypothetical protein
MNGIGKSCGLDPRFVDEGLRVYRCAEQNKQGKRSTYRSMSHFCELFFHHRIKFRAAIFVVENKLDALCKGFYIDIGQYLSL